LSCHDVTWSLDGKPRTGSMQIDYSDLRDLTMHGRPVKVIGYAKGDVAASLYGIRSNYGAARVGEVPLWVGAVGVLLIVDALFLVNPGEPR